MDQTTHSTPQATSRRNIYIFGAVFAGIILLAVLAAVALLFVNNSRKSSITLSSVNAANPSEALAKINQVIYDTVVQTAEAPLDPTSIQNEIAALDGFRLEMSTEVTSETDNLSLTGTGFLVKSAKEGVMDLDFSGKLSGKSSGFLGSEITNLNMNYKLKAVDGTLYFNFVGLPEEFAAQIAQIGITENKWYRIPAEELAKSGNSFTANNITLQMVSNQEELDTFKKEYNSSPAFINPKPAPNRYIGSTLLNCMTMEANPEKSSTAGTQPVEICKTDKLLPAFIGISSAQESSSIKLGLEFLSLERNQTVVAPEGSVDLTALMQLLLGGGN